MATSDYALGRSQLFTPAIAISGLGDINGLWWFCISQPASGAPYDGQWKTWLADYPAQLSERIDPDRGSVAEAGELAFSVLDYADGLTSVLRLDSSPGSAVATALTSAAATTLLLTTSLGITAPALIWVGWECMRVTATADSGRTLTVQRGYLATTPHESIAVGTGVFAGGLPSIDGRRVFAYLYPLDAAATVADAVDVGSFYVGDFGLGEALNTFEFSCPSRRTAHRRVFQYPWPTFEIESVHPGGNFTIRGLQSSTAISDSIIITIDDLDIWDDGRVWAVTDQGELVAVASTSRSNFRVLQLLERGLAGTSALEFGPESTLQFVLSASVAEGYGSFRFSRQESTSRAVGLWEQSAHAVDLMLCLLTSSAKQGDGLELTNLFSGYGNWSCLPSGLGCGVPADKIDIESFLEIKARYPDAVFPQFFLREPKTFEELVATEFLAPLGWILREDSQGRLQLLAERLPLAGDSAEASWGVADLLLEKTANASTVPRSLSFRRERASQYAGIEFSVQSASGESYTRTYQLQDYVTLFGEGTTYDSEVKVLQIDLGSINAETAGLDAILEQRALRWLWRHYRPQYRLTVDTDLQHHDLGVGDLVALTLRELPDLANGVRGWADANCHVAEKSFDFEDASLKWVLHSFGPGGLNIGRIAPSAAIRAVTGSVCSVHSNRYTLPEGWDGLPNNDALAFTPGDYVVLRNRDGSYAASGAVRVNAVAPSVISLASNFAGALASGLVLVTADYANQSTRQRERYTSWADRATRTVGASAIAAWRYGEP